MTRPGKPRWAECASPCLPRNQMKTMTCGYPRGVTGHVWVTITRLSSPRRTAAFIMSRRVLRSVAFLVLALLGAPVAMHVLLHDLHPHGDSAPAAIGEERGHGDHEHPVVSSAPAVTADARTVTTVVTVVPPVSVMLVHRASAHRNRVSPGALRLDDDVGLHTLLSTFLI